MSALVPAGERQKNVAKVSQSAAIDQAQYLTFMLGGEVFAVAILKVKEIIEYDSLTEVPMMPTCIRGVINLRGAVVPVMDLSVRFGKPTTAVTKRTCIVIVEITIADEQRVIGVVVDAVNAVLEIASSDIEAAPVFGTNIRSDFIAGMGKINNKFVILLNLDSILSIEEIGSLTDGALSP